MARMGWPFVEKMFSLHPITGSKDEFIGRSAPPVSAICAAGVDTNRPIHPWLSEPGFEDLNPSADNPTFASGRGGNAELEYEYGVPFLGLGHGRERRMRGKIRRSRLLTADKLTQ
jgi:hypothetical protein